MSAVCSWRDLRNAFDIDLWFRLSEANLQLRPKREEILGRGGGGGDVIHPRAGRELFPWASFLGE